MSRSNPTTVSSSPIPMWVEYKDGGTYAYYNSELVNEDGSIGGNVVLGEKISFLYVAHTFSLVGFNNDKNSYMYSNEVFNTSQPFTLIAMKDKSVVVDGLWKEKKSAFQGAGCKFGINLYALLKMGDKYQRCCIKTHGGNYGAWSEFITLLGGATQEQIDNADKNNKRLPFSYTEKGYGKVEAGAVTVTGHVEKKFGKVVFTVPVFKFIDKVSEEANNEAVAFDLDVQEYLKSKVSAPVTNEESAPAQVSTPSQAPKEDYSDQEMFGETVPPRTGIPAPGIDDEPFDEDDLLPF
jgi:hypothetical protein